MTEGDRQPVSFCSVVSLFHFVSRWRLGSLLFPCKLGVFESGQYRLADCCVRSFL